MRVKCLGGTLTRFLLTVIVFCNCSAQQAFFFGWNAIVVRIPNPSQIEIEEGGGDEEKLTLRGQARSQCDSKKNLKKRLTTLTFAPSSSISLCFYPRMGYILSIFSDTRKIFDPFILFVSV